MRSSKNRQRSKQNRPRTLGNIVNRVFDSSGPEGKVRGTPQQIIEKYLILARDAQLSNDRVAAENFLQHAEHYTRMLGEAQREMQAEQEARQAQGGFRREDRESEGWSGNGERRDGQPGNWRDQNGSDRREGGERANREAQPWREGGERREGGGDRPNREAQPWREGGERRDGGRREFRPDFRGEPRPETRQPVPADVVDLADDPRDSGLVETPEARVVAAPMMPQLPPPEIEAEAEPQAGAEGDRRPAARRSRGPRKPREGDAPQGETPAVAE
jgi:hypothetical protein